MKVLINISICLLMCLVLTLATAHITTAAGLDQNIVGVWMLDEGNGQDVKDLSNNHNDGKIQGKPKWVDGKFGKALQFADGDTVMVPNSDSLMPSKQITVQAWVTFTDAGAKQDMVIARVEPGFSLQKFNTDVMEGWVNIGGWKGVREVAGGTALKSNTWYHVAFTYDGTTMKTYVNGKPDREAKIGGDFTVDKQPFTIGSYKGENYYWKGTIDEVAISNVARSEKEINAMMGGFKTYMAVSSQGKLSITWAQVKNGK
jgi:hypothetical protein